MKLELFPDLLDICRLSEEIGIRHLLGDDTLTGIRERAKLNVPPSLLPFPFPYRDVTNERLERPILVRSFQNPQACREWIATRSEILAPSVRTLRAVNDQNLDLQRTDENWAEAIMPRTFRLDQGEKAGLICVRMTHRMSSFKTMMSQ